MSSARSRHPRVSNRVHRKPSGCSGSDSGSDFRFRLRYHPRRARAPRGRGHPPPDRAPPRGPRHRARRDHEAQLLLPHPARAPAPPPPRPPHRSARAPRQVPARRPRRRQPPAPAPRHDGAALRRGREQRAPALAPRRARRSRPKRSRRFAPDAHTHLRLLFDDAGPAVFFRDARKFGKVQLLAPGEDSERLASSAPTRSRSPAPRCSTRRAAAAVAIKTLLLDQAIVAGSRQHLRRRGAVPRRRAPDAPRARA